MRICLPFILICLLPGIAGAAEPVLRLDAGDPAALVMSGDLVATWKSAADGVSVTQDAPEKRPKQGTPLNGRTTLFFDGNDFLKGPAVLPEGSRTLTIIALWRPHRIAIQSVFEQSGSGSGRRAALLQVNDAYGFNGQANDFHSAVSVVADEWRLSTIVVNGSERNNVYVIDNDAKPVVGTIDTELQNVGIDGIIIGRKFTADGEYLQGDIAEIRIFDSVLSRNDLTSQLTEVKQIWGLKFESIVPDIAAIEEGKMKPVALNTNPSPEQAEFFESKVRPLLAQHCYECHSKDAKTIQAGLRLDDVHWVSKGGDSGAVVLPGRPDESLLIKSVRYQSFEMPPDGKLSGPDIDTLVKWVEMGSPWPAVAAAPAGNPEMAPSYDWDRLRNEHWAFRAIQNSDPPTVNNAAFSRNPIDQFVAAALETNGLQPNEPAARRTLIRRAYLDLTGLPPMPDQVEAFLADQSDLAFEKAVDELLASPQYGERWARHWLDVARYSDGLGGFLDSDDLPSAWHYRDWVINALNADMPYSEFVRRQIAGDILPEQKDAVATGFFAVGPTYHSDGGDPEATAQAEAETLSDRVDTFSRAFLGLTAACARCHDHKFDPITTKDYYAIAGVFRNTRLAEYPLAAESVVRTWQQAQDAIHQQNAAVEEFLKAESGRIGVDRRDVESQLSGDGKTELKALRDKLQQLKDSAPPKYETAHVLADTGSADMHVALRGDLRKKGELVPRRFLELFAGKQPTRFRNGSGRNELADAVVAETNPLTARVIVNRVWQWHFGEALVRTPSNFGMLGEKPTHPELLDWLAADFMKNGWSLKRLHRQILLSATWQMSSDYQEASFLKDGDNRFLWRMNPRKLDVESWRDSLLAVTGELDRTIGGAPIDQILESRRRSIYARISRSGDRFESDAFFRLFDFPAAQATAEKRPVTTVPQQYLFMMNSQFMLQRARALAGLLATSVGNETRIQEAYSRLFSRPADAREVRIGLAFLDNKEENWPQYAQVLLSSHEFLQVQ